MTRTDLARLAYRLLGLYLVVDALPRLVRSATTLLFAEGNVYSRSDLVYELPFAAAELLLGLVLLLQARGLARIWGALQSFGLEPPGPTGTPGA